MTEPKSGWKITPVVEARHWQERAEKAEARLAELEDIHGKMIDIVVDGYNQQERTADHLRRARARLKALVAAEAERDALQRQLAEVERQRDVATCALDLSEMTDVNLQRVQSLEMQLDTARSAMTQVQDDMVAAAERADAAERQLAKVTAERDHFSKRLSKRLDDVVTLREERDDVQRRLVIVESERDQAISERDTLKDEIIMHRDRVNNAEYKLTEAAEWRAERHVVIRKVQAAADAWRDRMEAERDAAETDRDRAEAQLATVTAERDDLGAEVRDHREELGYVYVDRDRAQAQAGRYEKALTSIARWEESDDMRLPWKVAEDALSTPPPAPATPTAVALAVETATGRLIKAAQDVLDWRTSYPSEERSTVKHEYLARLREAIVAAKGVTTPPATATPTTADLAAETPPHPEDTCQRCGRPNVVWYTPNAVWNRVEDGPNGILCPVCFIQDAEKAGIDGAWRVTPENYYETATEQENDLQLPVDLRDDEPPATDTEATQEVHE